MKIKAVVTFALVMCITSVTAFAQEPKLDGAYKWVSTKFPGGQQTENDAKGMIVVHGKYMAFVRTSLNRPAMSQSDPQEERMKKAAQAFQGIAATAGMFEVKGNRIHLQQVAQANPGTMGKEAQWEYKLEGKTLTLKPVGNEGVEFTFERLP
jgi:hypothetical protein